MRRFFVLITDTCWGVFAFDANDYPEVMYNNLGSVTAVEERKVIKFLLDHVGRNALIRNQFDIGNSTGKVFAR